MEKIKLGEMEQRMAELIWKHQPLTTKSLIELCQAAFQWKRTTTYTMLKRLCEKGLFTTNEGLVTEAMSRDYFYTIMGEIYLEESYGGSLPQFIAAFTKRKKLSNDELEKIKRIIADHKEE
jgi:predicted transcriptional regulator